MTGKAKAQVGLDVEHDTLINTVLIHPPIEVSGGVLFSREHTYQSYQTLGDHLARDFIVMAMGDDGIMRPYKSGTAGKKNENWFSWRKDILAPFNGVVTHVQQPATTNQPGQLNCEAQHGEIHFIADDGVTVSYVHVREIVVKEGQVVEAGEIVAKVGNNGCSIAPHVHVGAWEADMPLQIQLYLNAKERFRGEANQE